MHIAMLLMLTLSVASAAPPGQTKRGTRGEAKAVDGPLAESITFKDGQVAQGLFLEPVSKGNGGGGGGGSPTLFAMRRAWALKNLPERSKTWLKRELVQAQQARKQRRDRLVAWRDERSGKSGTDAKLTQWIGDQIDSLGKNEAEAEAPLLVASIDRKDVSKSSRLKPAKTRLLRLAWLAKIENPEALKASDLKGVLEAKGVAVGGDDPASIAELLPLGLETNDQWLIHRAATELKYDTGGAFIRQGPLLLPDVKAGENIGIGDAAAGLSALKGLLNPDANDDPLKAAFQKLEGKGKAGAMVTELQVAPDFSQVSVETVLFVRAGPGNWVPVGKRAATVRAQDVPEQNGAMLEGDPLVKQAFSLLESLGGGNVDPEMKKKALTIGATTQAALSKIRGEVAEDLDRLALPVSSTAPKQAGP